MKRTGLLFVVLLAAISFSCEDSISSIGDFSEGYALYCLLNADTTFQTAYISKSYQSESFNPYDNTIDPALEGATITLKVNNRTSYSFSEGVADRKDTSRYKTPLKYYFINNYKPNVLDNVEISAVLKSGKVLISNLVIPPYTSFYMSSFNLTVYNPDNISHQDLLINWLFNDVGTTKDHAFNYKLQLVYSKTEDPDNKVRVVMPLYYSLNNGAPIPVYPKLSKMLGAQYSYESIIRVLNSISEGDTNKENYIIHECEFSNQLIENNLFEYITSIESFKDEFSIRIDPTEKSNIQNGYGLFGAFAVKKAKIKIDKSYISSLGYRTSY